MTTFNWKFDTTHSQIGFSVRHMMIAKVRGVFSDWIGEFTFDPNAPESSWVRAQIQTSSIDTRSEQRDAHLRSADFFDSERFEEMIFESTSWRETDRGLEVAGDLTIRDVTRPIVLDVTSNGSGTDPWGNARAGFSASAVVSRGDFGLTWNQALETGGVLVGDDIRIELEVQAIRGEQVVSSAA